jgi:hypothetical protein
LAPLEEFHMDNHADFGAARRLEDIRLNQNASDAALQRDKEINALHRSLAAKGLFESGARYIGEVEIIFASIESVIERAVTYRRELGIKVPALLTAPNLNVFQDKLNQHIDEGVNGVRSRLTLRPSGSAGPAVIQEARRRASSLKAKVRTESESRNRAVHPREFCWRPGHAHAGPSRARRRSLISATEPIGQGVDIPRLFFVASSPGVIWYRSRLVSKAASLRFNGQCDRRGYGINQAVQSA